MTLAGLISAVECYWRLNFPPSHAPALVDYCVFVFFATVPHSATGASLLSQLRPRCCTFCFALNARTLPRVVNHNRCFPVETCRFCLVAYLRCAVMHSFFFFFGGLPPCPGFLRVPDFRHGIGITALAFFRIVRGRGTEQNLSKSGVFPPDAASFTRCVAKSILVGTFLHPSGVELSFQALESPCPFYFVFFFLRVFFFFAVHVNFQESSFFLPTFSLLLFFGSPF